MLDATSLVTSTDSAVRWRGDSRPPLEAERDALREMVGQDYIAVVLENVDREFSIHFPDVPGCATAGATRSQVCRFAAETLTVHLERLAAVDGRPAPVTRCLEAMRAHPELRDATFLLVEPTALAI
jgi:predicted RNase H-like HicB family nuclease